VEPDFFNHRFYGRIQTGAFYFPTHTLQPKVCEMSKSDVRWMQRLQNYLTALSRLTAAVVLANQRALTDLEQQGVVQSFEFTHELAWNVLKDYLEAQGFVSIIGSRNATREAFKNGLLADGQVWMDMIKARNQTSHTYNLQIVQGITHDIHTRFHPAFKAMEAHFAALAQTETDGV
jgi:nucleotidyltransferase substrate binding protein (TIGR01987 family)